MTKEERHREMRRVHVPEGYHVDEWIDRLDEGGPILISFTPDRTPEEEKRHREELQAFFDRLYTRQCLRREAEEAAGEAALSAV